MDSITFKHAFNAGDLLTILPGIQHLYKKTGKKAILYQQLNLPSDYGHNDPHPVRNIDGVQVCLNESMFRLLKPLIEAQEYIERFEVWTGQEVQFNFDLTRHNTQMPLPGGSIHKWASLIFPQLECDLGGAWINIPDVPRNVRESVLVEINDVQMLSIVDDKIIINRTFRYNNPYISYFFLKGHEQDLLFAGTRSEWFKFNNDFGLNIPYIIVNDFYELAKVIKSCRFFIGVQSFCWHLADGMKVPRILEVCTAYPNTFPTGANGYSFVSQGALQYFFNKLLTETTRTNG